MQSVAGPKSKFVMIGKSSRYTEVFTRNIYNNKAFKCQLSKNCERSSPNIQGNSLGT